MSAPDTLERVRMCVAEAGYDPALIKEPRTYPWASFETPRGSIPGDVLWRAREVASFRRPVCRLCFLWSHERRLGASDICRAVRRMELDCGLDR